MMEIERKAVKVQNYGRKKEMTASSSKYQRRI